MSPGCWPVRLAHTQVPDGQGRCRNSEKTATVEVIETKEALHLEPGVAVDDALVAELKAALRACAAWHRTPQVVVRYAA